jgi:hypothetical protein
MSVSNAIYRCPGNEALGYKCIRGTLFEENLMSGERIDKGPCLKCAGLEKIKPSPIVHMPNTPARVEAIGLRQITNNIMGHIKTPINAKHEEHIAKMRDIALEFYVALHDAGGTNPNEDRMANRNLAIAATEIEGALMHAIKGVCQRK